MTLTKSFTSGTSASTDASADSARWLRTSLIVATLLGLAVRAQRLDWQPLWWDEGYSVFFATEPLGRMIALTAQDIHPPLYYAALHGWIGILNDASPALDRLFSVGAGVVAVPLLGVLVSRLTNRSFLASAMAALLLAVNPFHVFYSQEVRMYSLATSLGLAATVCLVIWVENVRSDRSGINWLVAFFVLTVLNLHTLYYTALLALTQTIWALWVCRNTVRQQAILLGGSLVALLALLPWGWYSIPRLTSYVRNKVHSDQDTPLGLLEYAFRHLATFSGGHVRPDWVPSSVFIMVGLVGLLLLTTRKTWGATHNPPPDILPREALWLVASATVVPLLAGFLVNLRLPFFPVNGERLLLFTLPYFLALIAAGVAFSTLSMPLRALALSPLFIVSLLGLSSYYTVPRYVEEDYRPIVASVEQRGAQEDSVLAIFPWQVGYWRAYGQRDDAGRLISPQPEPVDQEILEWNLFIRAQLDSALEAGILWFPEPLALGTTLPLEIEAYLLETALNVEDRWFSDATRLTAWTSKTMAEPPIPRNVDFGVEKLVGSSLTPNSVSSDNSVVEISLEWERASPQPSPPGHTNRSIPNGTSVVLKLLDGDGREWSQRTYQPPGRYALQNTDHSRGKIDRLGIQVPVGLPPARYTLALSILDADGNPRGIRSNAATTTQVATLHPLSVTLPALPPAPIRVQIDYPIEARPDDQDMEILGVSGLGPEPSVLAGRDLDLRIVLRNQAEDTVNHEINLWLENGRGNSVAGWQGWTLPDYPTHAWPAGAIISVPVEFPVPPDVEAGSYSLMVGLAEQQGGVRHAAHKVTMVDVQRRTPHFDPVSPKTALPDAIQFGTHARLLGFDAAIEQNLLLLTVHWEVIQSLYPPHHVFVHVTDPDGGIIAQQDGAPLTSNGPAPSGSWLPGEFLSTTHSVKLPDELAGSATEEAIEVKFGLYNPDTDVRLPATQDHKTIGDSATLVIPR